MNCVLVMSRRKQARPIRLLDDDDDDVPAATPAGPAVAAAPAVPTPDAVFPTNVVLGKSTDGL